MEHTSKEIFDILTKECQPNVFSESKEEIWFGGPDMHIQSGTIFVNELPDSIKALFDESKLCLQNH